MKKFIYLLCAIAICSCTNKASNGNIEVYDAEAYGHSYLIFENENSGSIAVVHSDSCYCKINN